MQKRGWDLPSLFAKPCIAEQAGGALAAISHIDFTYRFHISISHITAKLEASFSVNGEQHTHLFGLFFDWLRLASASSSIGFDWLRPLLRLGDWNFGQGHDHELRNPVSLDSLEKHQKSIRNASEKHQKRIRKASETHQKSIRKALEKEA